MYPSDFADLIALLLRYIGVTARGIAPIAYRFYWVNNPLSLLRACSANCEEDKGENPYVQSRSYGTLHALMAREHPRCDLFRDTGSSHQT